MIREIIVIDEGRCDGCGICTTSCHEGALAIVKGKAKLVRDVYCDGLGNCVPTCPKGAISFVEREAEAFDINAGRLNQWPVQLKLVSEAGFFSGCDLLISADCAAYSCGSFHNDFMRGRKTVIGCPKLDGTDYSEKLAAIFKGEIKSLTVVKMEVPCCGGIEWMTKNALKSCGKNIPLSVVTLSIDGKRLEEN
jgi:NAD-dependent dihydropyrimidine dehydrogenase PreA subunit